MKKSTLTALLLALAVLISGCAGNIATTDNASDESTIENTITATPSETPAPTKAEYVGADKMDFKALADKAVINVGNTSRLLRVIEKAKRGEPVVIAAIGGSITAGAAASSTENQYIQRLGQWWRDTFPKCDVTVVNAGIGATTSLFGLHRVQTDLLDYNPDLVIVEFSVNDQLYDTYAKIEYEMLVRRILEYKTQPAVILLSMMAKDGKNVQFMHQPTAEHYNLTMVSYRDAIWPEMSIGRLKWEDLSPDDVHPNDKGHEIAAMFLSETISKIMDGRIKGDESAYQVPEKPVDVMMFKNARVVAAEDIKVKQNDGWVLDITKSGKTGWKAVKKGKPLVFEMKFANLGFGYLKWNTNTFGTAEVQVDDLKPVKLEGHFAVDWGGCVWPEMVAYKLDPNKVHKVSVTLLEDAPSGSTGEDFMIDYIMVSE